MANMLPPVKGAAFTFDISLVSQADTDVFKTSVTLAEGDITISKDGGSYTNIATLPTEIGTTGVLPVALSTDEMNADRVTVRFHDAAGDEWQDAIVTIYTSGQTLDTIEGLVDDIGVAGAGLTAIPTVAAVTTVGSVTNGVTLATGAVTAAAIATNAIDADALATDAVTEIGTGVWASTSRTLTQSAASVATAVAGSTITFTRGVINTITLTGLTFDAARTKCWFTVKIAHDDEDTESVMQIEETAGLLYLNGAAASTAADGSLTISGTTATIVLKTASAASLLVRSGMVYDIMELVAGEKYQITEAAANVDAEVTRRTS